MITTHQFFGLHNKYWKVLLICLVTTSYFITHHNSSAQSVKNSIRNASPTGDPGNENWTIFATGPAGGSVLAMVVDNNGDLIVGGSFTSANGVANTARIAKWNGSTWSALGTGVSGGNVNALLVDGNNLYVGGSFTSAGGAASTNYIAKWDGSTWSSVGGGITRSNALEIKSLIITNNILYAAGNFNSSVVATWSGSGNWNYVSASANNQANAIIADSQNNIYVGGNFTIISGITTQSRVAKLTAGNWSAVGDELTGATVNALALDANDVLYAGGNFTNAGGVTTVNRIAKLNGNNWSPVGTGLRNTVHALVSDTAGNIYAAGTFAGTCTDAACNTTAIIATRIAKWNGTSWGALGDGVGPAPRALHRDNRGNLYVGGDSTLTTAGGMSTVGLARWTAAEGQSISGTGEVSFYTNNLPIAINVVQQGSLARVNIQRFNKNHVSAGTNMSTGYYWEITGLDSNGAAATNFNINLTLPLTGADNGDKLCRFNSPSWDCGRTSNTTSSITRNGVTAFSDWVVENNQPLAVNLSDFNAIPGPDSVHLSWKTASELSNLGFNLWRGASSEKPTEQLNAQLIPSQAPGSGQGFSYDWIDSANLVHGKTYYYWIEAIDINGLSSRFGPISVDFIGPTAVKIDQIQATANPAFIPLSIIIAAFLIARALALNARLKYASRTKKNA